MGTAIRVELWSDDRRAGRGRHRRGDGRDAPHRPRDEPAQAGLRAVAHQPRRRRAAGAAQRRDVRPDRARARRSRACPTARSTSPTPASATCTTTAQASRPSDAALAGRAQAVGWRHLMLDARRAHAALRARRACASTSAASPRATRSTTRRRSCARCGIAPRHRVRRRRQPRARRPSRPAVDDRDPRSAPTPARWWRCCRWKTSRSRPRATTSASSSATACVTTTSSTRAPGKSPSGVHSVTILAADGLTSEALSKSRVRARRRAGHAAHRVAARCRRRRGRRGRRACISRPDCCTAGRRPATRPGNESQTRHSRRRS